MARRPIVDTTTGLSDNSSLNNPWKQSQQGIVLDQKNMRLNNVTHSRSPLRLPIQDAVRVGLNLGRHYVLGNVISRATTGDVRYDGVVSQYVYAFEK